MNTAIVLFLVVGAGFGLATYSNRHLFSEGATQRSDRPRGAADSRLMWVLISTGLWPLLALTGLMSLWRLSRVPARTRRRDDEAR